MSWLELPTISVTVPGSTTHCKSAFRMAKSDLCKVNVTTAL